MISHEYKAIFVHIPKSAGTSVGTKLAMYTAQGVEWGMQDHRAIRHLRHPRSLTIKQYLTTAFVELLARRVRDSVMLDRQYPTAEEFDTYYKFTFVRNSWARFYSWYNNVITDERHRTKLKVPKDATFRWFVDNRLNTLRDQLFYIKDFDGSIGVDFIGRFESVQDDFKIVCDKLGIADSALPRHNKSLNQDYIEHYDQYLLERVQQRYQADIEHFGFAFGR